MFKILPWKSASIFFIPLMILVTGCGGKTGAAPVVNLPPSLSWEEGVFSYQIDAEGQGAISFSLADSPDAALFVVDSTTGILSSIAPLDYENAQDDDQNNHYQLNIDVTDGNNALTKSALELVILNKNEYTIHVDFPIDGANAGGAESEFRIRGHLKNEQGERVSWPEELELQVAGVIAQRGDGDSSQWQIDATLAAGMNHLDIQLLNGTHIENKVTFTLDNSFLLYPRYFTSYGLRDNSIVGAAYGGKGIVESRDNGELNTLLTLPVANNSSDECKTIVGDLAVAGDYVLFTCKSNAGHYDPDRNTTSMLLLDAKSGAIQVLAGIDDTGQGLALSARYAALGFRKSVKLTHLASSTSGHITAVIEGDTNSENTSYEKLWLSGSNLYLNHTGSGAVIYKDLSSIENLDPSTPVTLTFAKSAVSIKNGATIQNNEYFYAEGGEIIRQNTITGEKSIVASSSVGSGVAWPFDNQTGFGLNAKGSYFITVWNSLSRDYILIDTRTGHRSWADSSPALAKLGDFSFDPDIYELVSYSRDTHSVQHIDLKSGRLIKQVDLLEHATSLGENYNSGAKYSWLTNTLYTTPIYPVFGYTIDIEAPLIISKNLESGDFDELLTYAELQAAASDLGDFFSVGDISFSDDPEALLVTVFGYHSESYQETKFTGIAKLIVGTGAIEWLDINRSFPEPSWISAGYIGDFNPIHNAYPITNWGLGHINILDGNDQSTQVLPANNPFSTTTAAVWSSQGDELFVATQPPRDYELGFLSFDPEISSVNMETLEHKLVAGVDKGRGIHLKLPFLDFDPTRNALIAISDGRLFILDPESGDRALWPLELH